jgi:hypothetical protein
MVTFNPNARRVFGDFVVDGIPSSGDKNPQKPEIRTLLTSYENAISAVALAGTFQGAWDASTGSFPSGAQKGYSWIASTPGTVGGKYFGEGDQLVALVNGASTSTYAGNWVVIPAWTSGIVPAIDAGAGTANAIQVTTEKPADDDTVVVFELAASTTGSPVTVSINGGAPLTIKTNRGNDASALTAGQEIWGRIRSSDSTFRLLNDQDVSALVAQAEEYRDETEALRDEVVGLVASVDLPDTVVADQVLTGKSDASGVEYKALGDLVGATGAGLSVRILKERWRRDIASVLDFIPTAQHAAIEAYTSTYDAAQDIMDAAAALGSGELHFPAGLYGAEDTVIVPGGVHLVGVGRRDYWGDNNLGTIIKGLGAGVAARWTDISGGDASDNIPLIVAGGNNVWLKKITLLPGDDGRTMGFMVPCMKQCGFDELDAFGFTDGCVYLDATWSDRNETMKALHPSIVPSTGMTEFHGRNFFLIGGGAGGFGLKIQGTTRAGDVVATASEWLWGWGGTSDCRFRDGRLGGVGANGGCFRHDAQLFGVGVFAQGVTIRDTAFRLSGEGRYAVRADRTNRLILDGCYGESVGSNVPVISVTSNTQVAVDGIIRVNDKLNADIWLNGAPTGDGGSTTPWETVRCISTTRANQMRMFTPNMTFGGNGASNLKIKSFGTSGLVQFAYDNGSSVTDFFRMFTTGIRPEADNTMGCGTGSFRFTQFSAASGTINTSDLREKFITGNLRNDAKLMAVAARLKDEYIAYQWNDAIEKKGEDGARIHFGMGAQTVGNAFVAEGLDPASYAIWCKDFLYDEHERIKVGEDGEPIRDADGEVLKELYEVPRLGENGEHMYRLGLRLDLLHMLMQAFILKRQDEIIARLEAMEG